MPRTILPLQTAAYLPACAIILFVSAAGAIAASPERLHRVGPFTRIASNATYGCRRPHGYGLYDAQANKTFVCWNGGGMSVFGRAYDHVRKSWSPLKEIRHLEYFGKWDYHNYPNMTQAPDGRLIVAWARHVRNLQVARAPEPHSLMGDWEHRVVGEGAQGYPMIFTHGDTVYIFYIVNADRKWPQRTFGYVKSTDSGKTWSEHRLAIDSQKKDSDRIDEVYAYHFAIEPAQADRPDRVHFTWVMRGGPKGHNIGSRNLYFAYFLPASATWRAADWTDLGGWVDYEEMLAHCVVRQAGPAYDTQVVKTCMSSFLPDGRPFVLYQYTHQAWQATWDGSAWRHSVFDKRLNVRGIRRMTDGSHRLLVSPPSQPSVAIYAGPGEPDAWEKTFEREIPYDRGANRTWSMGFIDNGLPEADVLMSQIDNNQEQEDYSGKWPVWVLSTDGADAAP